MEMSLGRLAFIEGLAGPEGILILFIVLVLFGGKNLPEFARGLGKSVRDFKRAASGVEEELKRALEEEPRPALTAPTEPATEVSTLAIANPDAPAPVLDSSLPKPPGNLPGSPPPAQLP